MPLPKLGIIGAGNLSTKRIYPNLGTAGAVLQAVCDLDRAKAEANAERFGGRAVHTDFREMLTKESLDGVIVCVGPEAHAELAPEVMRAGLPVYTEKPPAPTAEAAKRVWEVSQETGRLCMTAFKKRYARCYQRAKQFIDREIGEKRLISIDYCSAQYSNDSLRRSFLHDFCIHCIDLVRFLFGDADTVYAAAKGPDAYAVSLTFKDGSVGCLAFADGRSFGIPTEEVEITGSDGNFMRVHNSSQYTLWQSQKVTEHYEPPLFTSGGDSGIESGHLTELVAFVRAVGGDPSVVVSDIESSYRTMVLYEAIERSAVHGDVVTVET